MMNRYAASKMAFLAVVALGLLYGCATEGGTSSRAADPIVGTWSGRVDQPGSNPYQGVMTLSSPNGGRSSYPSLKCGGTLSGGGRATATSGGCIDPVRRGKRRRLPIQGNNHFWTGDGNLRRLYRRSDYDDSARKQGGVAVVRLLERQGLCRVRNIRPKVT